MADTRELRVPTYGNWRRPRAGGLGKLSLGVTMFFFGAAIVGVILMFATNLLVAFVYAVMVFGLIIGMSREDKHGRSALGRLRTRMAFSSARRRRTNLYRSGPLGFIPYGRNQLPGIAAESELSEWQDSWARPFGLIHLPSKNRFTVVFQGEPDGASLVDQSQVDLWVAHWGQWLAALGNEPGVVAASVTVETAPDFGARLRREVSASEDPNAPALARRVMAEIVDSYPRSSATVRALVAVTFKGELREGGHRRTVTEVAHDLASRIGLISQQLSSTGAGSVRPMTAQELCEFVRVSFDPTVAGKMAESRAHGEAIELDWSDVGPVGAEAGWTSYRHDSGLSRTWQMSQAPRGEVYSNVLQRLLEPTAVVDRKRVTLLFRPIDPARAAELVELDRKQAGVRATSTTRPSLRVLAEEAQALATAREEARGAGLVNFGMLVTATVLDEDRMPDAAAAIENLAASARLFLRPMYGAQDVGFVASLPVGLNLSDYLLIPQMIGTR